MAISISEFAARHITAMLRQRGHGLGMRLGLREAGCNGLSYVVDYADHIEDDDVIFESHKVKLIVHAHDLPRLDGTFIDYFTDNLANEGFDFHNPNVKDSCGCGESFNT